MEEVPVLVLLVLTVFVLGDLELVEKHGRGAE